MSRKILKSKWNLIVMLATMLLLIWIRTFIGIANGRETKALEILGHCVLTVLLTFMWGGSLYVWDDETGFFYKEDEEETEGEESSDNYHRKHVHSSGLQNSLCVVLALAVICLLSFALSDWTDWLNLFNDSKYMQIGWLCINRKYIYDVLTVIVFPIWTTFIIRKMKESEFAAGAVLSGIMQILALTVIGFLLYMNIPNIWLTEMAVLNVITLILAVHGYAWKNIRRKGNAVALLSMYTLLWISLMSVFHYSGQSFAGFMGFEDITQVTSYFSNVHKIVENASFIGQSSGLLNDPYVISFMKDSYYLIPSALFYGGWIPTILLMLAEVIFIVTLAGVLIQAREHDGRDIMLDMIWVGFLIRVAAGFLYAFGFPIAILLPFSGTTGIITDSICMGMLLMGYLNRKLIKIYRRYFDGNGSGEQSN